MQTSEEQAGDYAVLEDFLNLHNFDTRTINAERLLDMLCGAIIEPPALTTQAHSETEKLHALVGSADRLLQQLERCGPSASQGHCAYWCTQG